MKELLLKYGCNPNQKQAKVFMEDGSDLPFEVLNGKPGYINLLDAFNSYQLVSQLKQATNLPSASSFKHVSPTSASVGSILPTSLKKACFVNDVIGLDDSLLACAYARARGTDRLSSFGDFIALSDECDLTTAKLIHREVSDGIIAPSYSKQALELLKEKKKGNYCILKVNPNYVPKKIEIRDVFGVCFQQERNDYIVDENTLIWTVGETGDINGDGEVDVRDLIRLKKQAAGTDTGTAGDIDSDGYTDAYDLALLRKYFLGNVYNMKKA